MAEVRNILFIMCDQLRYDHLSCLGHPCLETPNVDWLARRGVLFRRTYAQSGVCGPSRMSFYTGRYVFSHGSTWNGVPLSLREVTLGDFLRPTQMRVAVVGKTHIFADSRGLERFGLEPASELGLLLGEGGFEPIDRHEGHVAPPPESSYSRYLRAQGYDSDDPWTDFVVSAEAPDGTLASGWRMRNARLPARVRDEHSETAYMTDQAIRFIEQQRDQPWLLHLSYIKPHWPYLAPAPYNDMYEAGDCPPPNRSADELVDAHPVVAAYRRHQESVAFARDEVIATVKPTYMGLVKQIDDHLGRLFAALEGAGRMDDTLIVFTSDHGEYLGDHWLGEKELFYEEAVRLPLIVYDPSSAADATRGAEDDHLVEAIDLLPTFLEAVDVEPPSHLVEGRSLLPLTRGPAPEGWRDAAFAELDYSFRAARRMLGRGADECRAFMVRTERWKYVHWDGFAPQLFDLEADPRELADLGADPAREAVRRELHERIFAWLRARKLRVTASDQDVEARTATHEQQGIYIGLW